MNLSAWMIEMETTGTVLTIAFLIISYGINIPISHAIPSSIIYISPSDSIQYTINNIDSNSTIILYPGIYNQSFTISKKITITCLEPKSTILQVTTQKNKPAITITTSNVHISHLTIENNGPGLYTTCIRILEDNITIDRCKFIHTPIGISIWTNNNTISNCTFINCSDEGIVLLGTSFSTANHNQITNCIFKQNCDGIELQQSSYNIIKNCLIINNTHSGIDGIDKNNNKNTIINCTIKNNQVHGIYFAHSQRNNILNCQFENNKDGDIITPHCENITTNFITPPTNTYQSTNTSYLQDFNESVKQIQHEKSQHQSILQQIINIIRTFLQKI